MLFQSFSGVHKNHTILFKLFFDVGIRRFRVILSFHSREECTLLLGHTETFECLKHLRRHFVPAARWLLTIREVVADNVEIEVLQIFRCPVRRHGFIQECLQCFVAILTHPVGVVFDITNVIHGGRRKPHTRVVFMVLGVFKIPFG